MQFFLSFFTLIIKIPISYPISYNNIPPIIKPKPKTMPTISGEQTHRHYLSRNQRKVVLFFLKCVIMLIVFSLFLFFLGFAAIVLFHFLIMSNTFSRRRRLCHRNAAVENPPPSQLLPNVSYISADFPTTSDCAICLDSFIDGEECRNLPVCKHLFHSRCVDRWIGKRPTCPVCRTRVDLDPDGLSGLGGVDRWKRLWAAVDFEEGSSN